MTATMKGERTQTTPAGFLRRLLGCGRAAPSLRPAPKRGKGVIYQVPLLATQDAHGIRIEPHPDEPHPHWDAATNTFTFRKKDFKMRKQDHHLVEFTVIEDRTNRGVRFPDNKWKALWVVNGARCPRRGERYDWDLMRPLAVVADNSLLAVNYNDRAGEAFGFTLNFVENGKDDTNEDNFIPWDPIGSNENGGV